MSEQLRHTQKRPVAKGVVDPKDPTKRWIAIAFDDETFEAVRQKAIAEGTSFAEQVRIFTEWGLEGRTQ